MFSFRGLRRYREEATTCDQCWDEVSDVEDADGWMECGDCECLLCSFCVEESRICQSCDSKQRLGEKAPCQYPVLCQECTRTCEDCGSKTSYCRHCIRDHELTCINKSKEKKELVKAVSEIEVKEIEVKRLKRKLQIVSNQLIKAEGDLEDARHRKDEAHKILIRKMLGDSNTSIEESPVEEQSLLKSLFSRTTK